MVEAERITKIKAKDERYCPYEVCFYSNYQKRELGEILHVNHCPPVPLFSIENDGFCTASGSWCVSQLDLSLRVFHTKLACTGVQPQTGS